MLSPASENNASNRELDSTDKDYPSMSEASLDEGAVMSAEDYQAYAEDELSQLSEGSIEDMAFFSGLQSDGLETDGLHAEMDEEEVAELQVQLAEASEHLFTIRDFIRFVVTQLRSYDVVVAQGTTDVFAEASAIVLQPLSLQWSADEQILDCRLTPKEIQDVLALLYARIIERKPLSYLINLAYFCDLPFYVDERVLIPRSPIAELIRQQFYPYFDVNELAQPLGAGNADLAEPFFAHGLELNSCHNLSVF